MERFDFAQHGLEGWHAVAGRWGVEDMPSAPSGQRVLSNAPWGTPSTSL